MAVKWPGAELCRSAAEGSQVMAVDVTPILAEVLARNRGHDPLNPDARQPPDYGVIAALEGSTLDMVLTFRKGSAYCCMEWGCHLPLIDGKRWHGLRRAFAAHGVTAPPRLELRLACVVEEGALFFDPNRPDPTRRGWYAFARAANHRYQISASEAGSDAE
jgi:hypothetical protein